MIDFSFIKLMILVFKIFFYSEGVEEAAIDLLQDNQLLMTLEYKQTGDKLTITPVVDSVRNPNDAFVIYTMDNALYEFDLGGGDRYTIDLAEQYSALNWDELASESMEIPGDKGLMGTLFQGKNNIYISDDTGRLFVLSRSFIQ